MTNNSQQPDIAKIRQLLLAAFTPEELDRLFRFASDPQLQKVVTKFGPGDGLTSMADKAISYCQRHLLFPDLLAEVRRANPRQYARFIEPELSDTKGTPPTPEILTIFSPSRLDLVRIPAGEFQMGSVMARDRHAKDDEFPQHPVHVPEFHIGRYPVTNRLQPSTTRPLILQKRVSGTPPTPRITIPREFCCSPPVMTPIQSGFWKDGTFVPATMPPWSPPTWCPTLTPKAPLRHARSRP